MAAAERARVTPADLITGALRGTDEVVAVTGATGWFGAVALELLHGCLGDQGADRVVGYASSAREVVLSDGRAVMVRPLAALLSQDPPPTTVLHLAFLTRDKVAELGIDAYVSQNVAITATVLGAIARHRPRQVVVMSSGAVHNTVDNTVDGGAGGWCPTFGLTPTGRSSTWTRWRWRPRRGRLAASA